MNEWGMSSEGFRRQNGKCLSFILEDWEKDGMLYGKVFWLAWQTLLHPQVSSSQTVSVFSLVLDPVPQTLNKMGLLNNLPPYINEYHVSIQKLSKY